MSNIYTSITQLVGKTPLFEIKNYEEKNALKARVLVKLEYYNPAQSVKDRIALAMIEAAEKDGRLKPGYTIVEVTSGNTGIGLAAFAASKGYKFRVYIADDVSIERFQIIKAFGGEIIKLSQVPQITKTMEETGGDFMAAIKALKREVLDKEENIFFTDQSANTANSGIHEATTGPEIWTDTDGKVDIFVSNIGTGGTLTGTGRYLKKQNPSIKIVALEPTPQSLPSKENPKPEQITGVHPFDNMPEENPVNDCRLRAIRYDQIELADQRTRQAGHCHRETFRDALHGIIVLPVFERDSQHIEPRLTQRIVGLVRLVAEIPMRVKIKATM